MISYGKLFAFIRKQNYILFYTSRKSMSILMKISMPKNVDFYAFLQKVTTLIQILSVS